MGLDQVCRPVVPFAWPDSDKDGPRQGQHTSEPAQNSASEQYEILKITTIGSDEQLDSDLPTLEVGSPEVRESSTVRKNTEPPGFLVDPEVLHRLLPGSRNSADQESSD